MNTIAPPPRHLLHAGTLTIIALALAACNLPTDDSEACTSDDLVAPGIAWPTDGAVVDSLSPTLTWVFTGGCRPDSYRLRLYSPGPDFPLTELFGEADGSATDWVPPAALQPGTPYIWQIAAVSGDVVGPFSPDPPGGLTTGVFWTGPTCMRADPSPWPLPELLLPEDGAAITSTIRVGTVMQPYVEMTWNDPLDCYPAAGYLVEISSFADFRSLETLPESPSLFTPRGTFLRWVQPLGWEWQECAPYYWRVKVNLPEAPYSDVSSFLINTTGGSCVDSPVVRVTPGLPEIVVPPTPTTGPAGPSVTGWTYIDENVNDVRDPGEGAVSGALLTLRNGACPGGTEVVTVESDSLGRFQILLSSSGDYCLLTSPLQQTLDPESRSLSVGPGEALEDVNFRYLLEPPTPPTPTAPMAKALVDAACRLGPDSRFENVDYLMQGDSSPIVGRHPQGTWWVIVRPDQGGNCWILADKVEASGDLLMVPVVMPPPLPTATPVLGCWTYNEQQQLVCTVPCPAHPEPGGVCTP
jgi:hypothetical protein